MPANQITNARAEATDLGTLWTKACNDYVRQTGRNLSRDMTASSITDVMKFTEKSMESFAGFRNKGEKVDRVRSAFGRHLEDMEKCMHGIRVVGNVAAAFPPAMPIGLVFAACGHLLAAFASVKADYDKVEEFFNLSSRFFERLSIIENRDVDVGALGKAIFRVFSAQLSICGIVESMTRTKDARFKQWLSALWNMGDPDLAAAFGIMQQSIEELAETVGYASYAEIKTTQAVTNTMSTKVDEIDTSIKKFRSELGQDVRMLYESQVTMRSDLIDGFRLTHDGIKRTQTLILEQEERQAEREARQAEREARFHASLLKAVQGERGQPDLQDKDKRKQIPKGSGKGDPGDKKFRALRSIKAFFDNDSETFPNWRDAHKENAAQEAAINASYVDHTADWISSEPEFQQWAEGKSPLLWIKGPEGIGKSYLAHAILQKIPQHEGGQNSLAYFYFKEDFPHLQSAQNAFACAALQVAETNTRYAEHTAKRLKKDQDEEESKDNSTTTWRRFFLSAFAGTSQGVGISASNDQLYLIFDGLDEAQEQQKKVFVQFMTDLVKDNTKVHVLVTSRSEETSDIRALQPLIMDVTKDKMSSGIKALIRNALKTFWRLDKFSHATKKIIRRKVAQQADGMLYVDHMLRRLSYIGREGAVLKDLENMPKSLHALYKLMIDECRRNRTKEQYSALKALFAWLAFSKRSLTLAEASGLVDLTITDDGFDIEDEIIWRSARIFKLSRTRPLEEDNRDDTKDEDNENEDQGEDGVLETDEYRKAALTFQERSLRQYFRALSVESKGEEELRTPPSAAHLTIMTMCIDVLINAAEAEDTGKADLQRYAIDYWYAHFNDLDIDNASDEDVSKVLTSVYQIVSNKSNVAKLFEQYASCSDMYPARAEGTTMPWYDKLHLWVKRGSSISTDSIGAEVRAWIATLVANPNDVLLPLSQGHVQNWRTEIKQQDIKKKLPFAIVSLELTGRYTEIKGEPEKNLLAIADSFGKSDRDAHTLQSIGTGLFYIAWDADEEEEAKRINSTAESYLEQSIELMADGSPEKGYTLFTLSMVHYSNGHPQLSLDTVDKGLQNFQIPESRTHNVHIPEVDWTVLQMYLRRGMIYLYSLEKKEEALRAYDRARQYAGEQTLDEARLDDMTCTLDETTDPDGRRLMDMLTSWNEKERNVWFEWCLGYNQDTVDLRSLGRLYRAAKLTGQTDLVPVWLDAYGRTLTPRSRAFLNLKDALAQFHSKELGDEETAKEIMRNAIALQLLIGDSPEDRLHEMTSRIRMDLAGIIFAQFRASPDPGRKIALLEEMKSLPGMRTDDELRESHIGMMVANMLRIMGPAREYQTALDKIFKTCIAGLEDNVSWNDGDSLRLLVKVLGSLDGLQRDACVTFAAQFSVMTRTLPESNSELKATANASDAEEVAGGPVAIEQNEPKQVSDGVEEDGDITQPETTESAVAQSLSSLRGGAMENGELKEPTQPISTEAKSDGSSDGPQEATVSKLGKTVPEPQPSAEILSDATPENNSSFGRARLVPVAAVDSTEFQGNQDAEQNATSTNDSAQPGKHLNTSANEEPLDSGLPESQSQDTENDSTLPSCEPETTEESSADVAVTEESPKKGEIGEHTIDDTASLPEITDENIADFNVSCDGGCGKNINSWTMPFYLCLICPNTDLCEDCHCKRLEWNQNGGDNSWKSFCGKNHHYVKGPMKGWKGVKNGVFRIGDEEIEIKEWIRGLKEERWPKAWEGYWLRQGGLKDIGVE